MRLFRNPRPLTRTGSAPAGLPPREEFPVVVDLRLVLRPGDPSEWRIRLESPSLGYLASLPWYDRPGRTIREVGPWFVPGSPSKPWDDTDEGWTLLVWTDGEWVYVMEADEVCATEFQSAFRVHRAVWERAWNEGTT
jgi:hypothetical protein